MLARKTSDLHLHLNGSLSESFLEKLAKKNNAMPEFLKLIKIRQEYAQLLADASSKELQDQSIKLIWKQFELIHSIVKSLDDIQQGTVNVVEVSKARYLEIRTTPKPMNHFSWEHYAAAFVNGLAEANQVQNGSKIARGLLSLDRTYHDLKAAYAVVDFVAAEKAKSGLLVGIDISGNPKALRKLTGDDLTEIVLYALSKNIGVAIHIGEVESELEKSDVNLLLQALAAWSKTIPEKNPFAGRVRLGHGIFLTDAQRELIKQLQIPIEVCPSCHKKLFWWKESNPHPVTRIYSLWKDPVVTGTDDEMIFGANAKEENAAILEILGYPKNQKKAEARIHQATFRFS